MKKQLTLIALSLAAFGIALPAMAQNCSDVKYRLWRKGADAVWTPHGGTLEVTTGEEVHFYIHTKGRGNNSYSTSAQIGYPHSFGLGGKAQDVRRHLRMNKQNSDDVSSGRLRMVAEEPGTTRLGYRLQGVKSPGKLANVARACHVGSVQVIVRAKKSEYRPQPTPPAPKPTADPARQAATELVEILYQGILRRPRTNADLDSYVVDVMRDGIRGVEKVGKILASSDEFRYEALRRVDEERGRRRDLDALRSSLLDSIYRDLYGYLSPNRSDHEADLDDLELCLSSDRDSFRACETLGRNLVSSDLFFEQHEGLIEDAQSPRGRGRR